MADKSSLDLTSSIVSSMTAVSSHTGFKSMLKFSLFASDLVGRVQIPVKELMENPNQMIRRADSLKGFEDQPVSLLCGALVRVPKHG
jgi:hypothetical protein